MRRMGLVCFCFAFGCQWHVYDSGGGSGDDDPTAVPEVDPSNRPSEGCDGVPIDTAKELLIVDPSVIEDARAKSDSSNAPWSLRARLEEMAGDPSNAATLATKWLGQWATVTSVGPYGAPVIARPRVQSLLLDTWQQASRVPFRLIAIVNRIDLRTDPSACVGGAGELRFVYTAVDSSGSALAMTVIVEVPYPSTRTPHEWATKWHALGQLPFGAQYNQSLAALTTDVTSHADWREVHVRTNEVALGENWELREFALQDSPRALVQVPLDRTPRYDMDNSATLTSWLKTSSSGELVPESMRGGAAPVPSQTFRWSASGIPADVRTSFSNATCNGCHGGEHVALPFQHLAPGDGYYGGERRTRVSPFMKQEVERRSQSMQNALCSSCGGTDGDGGGGGSNPYGTEPSHPSCPR